MDVAEREREESPMISAVVARSVPACIIGKDNKLPWRMKTDLAHFKQKTRGHAIIMGRKTFTSMPGPLPGRLNIVLSRTKRPASKQVVWVADRDAALYHADQYCRIRSGAEIVVIGGVPIFDMFDDVITRYWMTEVFGKDIEGDTFFPYKFNDMVWKKVSEQSYGRGEGDTYPCTIACYDRRVPVVR
jgi:dihydrofolate reductase